MAERAEPEWVGTADSSWQLQGGAVGPNQALGGAVGAAADAGFREPDLTRSSHRYPGALISDGPPPALGLGILFGCP